MINIKAKPINYNQEEFKKQVKTVLNNELIKGWVVGMKSMATTVSEKLKGYDESTYKEKIEDVLKYCNWVSKDDKLEDTMKNSNNIKKESNT